jgi:hypothetical protein
VPGTGRETALLQARDASPELRPANEADLDEVFVEGKSLIQAETVHRCEGDAVGEGKNLVRVLQE